jgi:putative phosphoesterase
MNDEKSTVIGVIADTHGILSDQAVEALQGVALIIHAGDMDDVEVLERLEGIAPVTAVRGNMDRGPRLGALPASQVTEVGEMMIYTIHDLGQLDLDPKTAGFRVVIYGHYHRPEVKERGGVLFLNPGSPSFPRGGSKRSLALLSIRGKQVVTEFKTLE